MLRSKKYPPPLTLTPSPRGCERGWGAAWAMRHAAQLGSSGLRTPVPPRYVLTHLYLRRRTRNIWPGHFVLTPCTLLDYAASNTTTRAWILLMYSDDSAGGRGVLILIARSEPTLGFL